MKPPDVQWVSLAVPENGRNTDDRRFESCPASKFPLDQLGTLCDEADLAQSSRLSAGQPEEGVG